MIDEKFIDDFIQDACELGENNRFIFLFSAPTKFVKSTLGIHAPHGSTELENVLAEIGPEDKLFVHWYTSKINALLEKIPSKTRVFLCFWGGDFLECTAYARFNNPLNRFLYDPLTLQLVRNHVQTNNRGHLRQRLQEARASKNFKNLIATQFSNLRLAAQIRANELYRKEMSERKVFLQRIEAICHWNPFDVDLLNKMYGVHLQQHYFIYGLGISEMEVSKPRIPSATTTIWLGNSDTPTNNHLDALIELKSFAKEPIKIICPLNYGNRKYAEHIAKFGSSLFGDKFVPLLDYIPRERYYQLMDEVDIAIMHHNRSQAGGNTIAFIMKGKKVYLKDQSSISQLFHSWGIRTLSGNALSTMSFDELKSSISDKDMASNIQILQDTLGNEEKRREAYKTLFSEG
ncbi:MAG: hypothetical protein A3D92_08055 [Bacteroidetes bacterium RIFCSPHIGHO2_02_FULL_44_7]|nr:MAG: hypothetical protein A3D92_08055 [Bacteroidetes bacterium RIFCSPHIGHO2_02_FULL_44_7]